MLSKIESFIEHLIAFKGGSLNTAKSYKYDLCHYERFCDSQKLNPFSKKGVFTYLTHLNKTGTSTATERRRYASLNHYFTFLKRENEIEENFLDNTSPPRRQKTLPSVLSEAEVDSLFAALEQDYTKKDKPRLALLLELFYATGARVSEILALRWRDVLWEERCLRIYGKGDKERLVVLTETAYTKLKEYAGGHTPPQNAYLFTSARTGKPLTRQRFFQQLKELARLANLPPETVHPHALRHAFATHLLKRGANLMTLKNLLGHTDISTTEIYTHLTQEDLAATLKQHHPLSKL